MWVTLAVRICAISLDCRFGAIRAEKLQSKVLQSEIILLRWIARVCLYSRLQLPFQLNCFTVHRQPMTPALSTSSCDVDGCVSQSLLCVMACLTWASRFAWPDFSN